MSSIIKFSAPELRRLASSGTACVEERRMTQSLALQPWCLANLKESIKNLLDYKIGKFDKEYNGILLSYKNLKILQNIGAIRNDHSDIHFQVQADYFIFRPYEGATLRGIVNKKSVTHLGIIVHRVFNVVIPRPTEEPGNRWIGTHVQEGQEVAFKIVMLDLFGALPYIRGELDESSLQENQDEDNERAAESMTETMNVSHVKFDKTKPQVNRQSGDCSEENKIKMTQTQDHSTSENSTPQCKSTPQQIKSKHTPVSNGKERLTEEEKVAQKTEKKKQKRLRLSEERLSENQTSNSTVRPLKKHKLPHTGLL